MTNAEIYTRLIEHRGFGGWSAQYIIMRGLGRPDWLPSGDAGLRRTVGKYLARGRRLSSKQLEHVLAPYLAEPFA
jgi:3-methyladenine DNA glycosylase/8-oxoguanine DNA glycosylase